MKRKKIIPATTNVKAALPTPALRKLIARHKAVVSGQATTYKLPTDLPPKVLKDLRALGYKTTGTGADRRLIVPTSQYVRKGQVYEKPTRSRRGYKIERTGVTVDRIEEQVRAAFEGLKPGDLAGFEVGDAGGKGGRSFNLYGSSDSMIEELTKYQERGFKFSHLAVFRVTQARQPDFRGDASRRARERIIGTPEARAKRAAIARENRKKRGRTSRGH